MREEREEAFQEGIMIGKEKYREEVRNEVRAEEREEGHREGMEEVARNALAEGLAFDFVQKISGLDIETLRNFQPK